MNHSEKVKLIRKNEGLTQKQFSEMTSIPLSTLKKIETGATEIGISTLDKITNHPNLRKYTLWLMTGETASLVGQIQPNMNEDEDNNEEVIIGLMQTLRETSGNKEKLKDIGILLQKIIDHGKNHDD